jgi:hypothetical protein
LEFAALEHDCSVTITISYWEASGSQIFHGRTFPAWVSIPNN